MFYKRIIKFIRKNCVQIFQIQKKNVCDNNTGV